MNKFLTLIAAALLMLPTLSAFAEDAVFAIEISDEEKEAAMSELRQRMAEHQASQQAEVKKQMGMSQEEFDAIKPLLIIVENLRAQNDLIDEDDGRSRERGDYRRNLMLGDAKLDPTVVEIKESLQALQALVADTQADATALTSAIARLRKARDGFTAVLDKAQKDLRAVLTPRQEAMLIDHGTLD